MFETARCVDCEAMVSFSGRPGDGTCSECGVSMYLTADGMTGRYPPEDWRPGELQRRRDRNPGTGA
jgi:hypothetical protein